MPSSGVHLACCAAMLNACKPSATAGFCRYSHHIQLQFLWLLDSWQLVQFHFEAHRGSVDDTCCKELSICFHFTSICMCFYVFSCIVIYKYNILAHLVDADIKQEFVTFAENLPIDFIALHCSLQVLSEIGYCMWAVDFQLFVCVLWTSRCCLSQISEWAWSQGLW